MHHISNRSSAKEQFLPCILDLSEGNVGSIRVFADVVKANLDPLEAMKFFQSCDALNLRKWKVWSAYQHCDQNLTILIQKVVAHDLAMLKAIQETEEAYKPYGW